VIHAVMIETEPLFLLEASRHRLPLNDALRHAMTTLDFSVLPMAYPAERPYHFELVVNPHDLAGGAYVTTMYKRPYREDYPRLAAGGKFGPGDDVLHIVGTISDTVAALVPGIVGALAGTFYAEYPSAWGTLGEFFTGINVQGKTSSTEIGLPLEAASNALDATLAAHRGAGPFAGLFAFRFVKRSPALLAFTKYDTTCTIELPGAFSQRSENFFQRTWDELDGANIPYTLHWGQENNFTPQRVRSMYGNAVDRWIDSRHRLLDAAALEAFSSPFLEQCGLAG
jgi:hypothetical protein